MAVTLNASTSSGLVQSADTSGVITLQNNGTNAVTVDSGNLKFNSGYGSVATGYGCRAWVNFNGTSTPSIRASGNVSSITDVGTGVFTINFTNAMPDTSYSTVIAAQDTSSGGGEGVNTSIQSTAYTTSAITINQYSFSGSYVDLTTMCVAIFR